MSSCMAYLMRKSDIAMSLAKNLTCWDLYVCMCVYIYIYIYIYIYTHTHTHSVFYTSIFSFYIYEKR